MAAAPSAKHPLSDAPVVLIGSAQINLFNACVYLAATCRLADVDPFTTTASTVAQLVEVDVAKRGPRDAEWTKRNNTDTESRKGATAELPPCVLPDVATRATMELGSSLWAASSSTATPSLCKFTYSSHHYPSGLFKLVESLSYPTPQGIKCISRAAVDDHQMRANRQYVTDLLPDRYAVTSEQLHGASCTLLDEARFALLAMTDLVVARKVFNPDGSLTGLAKRDLKKNCAAAAGGNDSSAGASTASAAPAPSAKKSAGLAASASATGVEVEKNTKGILLEKCTAMWPFIPPDKALTFTFEQDPDAPRHKPRFKATVVVTGLKGKQTSFAGEWCNTKRDTEITACSAALVFLSRGGK